MNELVNGLFNLCCDIMTLLGKVVGMTYEEICVVGNLWIQGGIVLLTSFLPLVRYICKYGTKLTFGYVLSAVYAVANVFGFVAMLQHYNQSLYDAFYVCVHELEWLAAIFGTTYEVVNIVIFVILFLFLIAVNCLWAYNIKGGKK